MSSTPPIDPSERNALILRLMPIVHREAGKVHARTPRSVELDDLTSAGLLGLIRAVDKYDRFTGVSIEWYAARRIRGAILDELRACDWVPRRVRARGEAPGVVSLSRTRWHDNDNGDRAGGGDLGYEHADPGAADPACLAELRDQVDWVWRRLLPRERQVLALYFAGVYLEDIGRSLRVSKGRVVQIKARALARLQAMAADDPLRGRRLRVAP